MISFSTDGAPAMIGKEKGVVKRIRNKNSNLITYQCIIHQVALCGKLSARFKEVMDNLVKLINFMRSHSALQHRNFKEFLPECDSAYSDLLEHNNACWLSKGQVIGRFWLTKEHVISFLQNIHTQGARAHFEYITNRRNILVVAFLKDILKYLNALNTDLQGNGKLVCDLIQSVSAFRRKLDIFENNIVQQEFIHFPTILEYNKNKEYSEEDTAVFVKFLGDLRNEFASRFHDFAQVSKLSSFLKSPFVDAAAEWTDVAAMLFNLSNLSLLQMEIIELQEDLSLQVYISVSAEEFWAKHVPAKYENYRQLAINLATMFGSTYMCETSFSNMNFLKKKYRSRLTDAHLEDTLRLCCSTREPDHKQLAQDRRCNFSD
ncbi:general transcription factor II-I repeat domain-containing protein 2B-like [Diabrotica undecimpunctata]|uniref:general transcription factor II-I repeat domain-containing protein 2B-like n=1 Tax=Diabrotica undecimpunctata TaxID=50387 RepID=UPI003B635BC6